MHFWEFDIFIFSLSAFLHLLLCFLLFHSPPLVASPPRFLIGNLWLIEFLHCYHSVDVANLSMSFSSAQGRRNPAPPASFAMDRHVPNDRFLNFGLFVYSVCLWFDFFFEFSHPPLIHSWFIKISSIQSTSYWYFHAIILPDLTSISIVNNNINSTAKIELANACNDRALNPICGTGKLIEKIFLWQFQTSLLIEIPSKNCY